MRKPLAVLLGLGLFVALVIGGEILVLLLTQPANMDLRMKLHQWLPVLLVAPLAGFLSGLLAGAVWGRPGWTGAALAGLAATLLHLYLFWDVPLLRLAPIGYLPAMALGGWLGGGRCEEFHQRDGSVEQGRKDQRRTGTCEQLPGSSREDDALGRHGVSRC